MASQLNNFRLGQGSRFINAFKRYPRWPNAEASAGDFVESMKGNNTCWDVIGPARAQYEDLSTEINEHLEQCGDPALKGVPFSLFMIGPTKRKSNPTIVFFSSDKDSRDLVRLTVKRTGILERYPGFRTMAADQAMGIGKPKSAMEGVKTKSEHVARMDEKRLILRPTSQGLAGGILELYEHSPSNSKSSTSTIGGLFEWQGRWFALTAAHIFDESIGSLFSNFGASGELEYDIDEVEDDDSETETDTSTVDITSQGSLTPEVTRSSQSGKSSRYSDETSTNVSTTSLSNELLLDHTSSHPTQGFEATGPWVSSAGVLEPFLDVALIEIPVTESQRYATEKYGISDVIGDVIGEPGSVDVCVITRGENPVNGRLSGTPTFVMSTVSQKMQELWTIHCEQNLVEGDSGAWVVGAQDRRVYGHVVAISSKSNFAYIVPLKKVFSALEEKFGHGWHISKAIEKSAQNLQLETVEHSSGQSVSKPTRDWQPRDSDRRPISSSPDDTISSPATQGFPELALQRLPTVNAIGGDPSAKRPGTVLQFHKWVKSSDASESGIGGLSHDKPCNFIPQSKLQAYMDKEELKQSLDIVVEDSVRQDVSTEYVSKYYLRPFAILLCIGQGSLIQHFVKHKSLRDNNLPFDSRPSDFPYLEKDFFDEFQKSQWKFCPVELVYNMNECLKEEEILPFTLFEEIGWDGTLEDFMRESVPPSNHEDTFTFWDHLCNIMQGLASIHNAATKENSPHQSLIGWHQDIKPANILVVSGTRGSAYDCNFKVADLGLSHFKDTSSTQSNASDFDACGTRAYGAPEIFRPDEEFESSSLSIKQDADIWSAGCLYSEAATWICHGYEGVLRYRRKRKDEINDKLLTTVTLFHDTSTEDYRAVDEITVQVLERLVALMLQRSGSRRPNAITVYSVFKQIVASAEKKVGKALNERSRHHFAQFWLNKGTDERLKTPPPLPLIFLRYWPDPSLHRFRHGYIQTSPFSNRSSLSEDEAPPSPSVCRGHSSWFWEQSGSTDRNSLQPSDVELERHRNGQKLPLKGDSHNLVSRAHPSSNARAQNGRLEPSSQHLQDRAHGKGKECGESTWPILTLERGLEWKASVKEHRKRKYRGPPSLPGDYQLPLLKGRDHVFLIDNSESMKPHMAAIKQVIELLAYILKDSDPTGLVLHFTQSNYKRNAYNSTELVKTIDREKFAGITDMRFGLSQILAEYKNGLGGLEVQEKTLFRRKRQMPISLYIFTDGIWQPESDVAPILLDLVKQMEERDLPKEYVGIQFIRFGEDRLGIERLDHLEHSLGLKERKL
ncbi:MAG: hypothetical protein Q9164_004751 [Protoblastenia rupestris]